MVPVLGTWLNGRAVLVVGAAVALVAVVLLVSIVLRGGGATAESPDGGRGFTIVPKTNVPPPANLRISTRPRSAEVRPHTNHEWIVSVLGVTGEAVLGCQVTFDGSMPEHGHGLPTAPRATQELRPGEYLVEGVRFSMPGHWELKVGVAGCGPIADGKETATFDVQL